MVLRILGGSLILVCLMLCLASQCLRSNFICIQQMVQFLSKYMHIILFLQLKGNDGVTPIGCISKQWTGLVKEAFTDADNFGIQFPGDLDVTLKAVLLGACFLIVRHFAAKCFLSLSNYPFAAESRCNIFGSLQDFMFFEMNADGHQSSSVL